jgi:hypothetical protein
MNYNDPMKRAILLSLLLAAVPAFAADKKVDDAGTADATTVRLAEYFLKTDLGAADPKLVSPFLAVDPATLPKRLRVKTAAKQIEIHSLLKLHDTKKKGNWLQEADKGCQLTDIVKPLKDIPIFQLAEFVDITEEEEQFTMQRTKCTELDLGCQFTLIIFFDKGKPRRLMLQKKDPLFAIIAQSHGKGGQTNFFGAGLSCYHPAQ